MSLGKQGNLAGATLMLPAAILVLAGCGSSSGPESTRSLTKAEFLKKGDAICAKGGEEINRDSLRQAGPEFAFYKSYSMGIDYGLEKCWLS